MPDPLVDAITVHVDVDGVTTMTLVSKSFHWVRNPDGTYDGAYPAGNKPGSYVALTWTLGSELNAAGIDAMVTGTPFNHNVRQYLSGTDAATATITFVLVSGSDPTTNGWTAPGAGNNIAYNAVAAHSGSFKLLATGAGSSATSAAKTWACTAVAQGTRNVWFTGDMESGAAQPADQRHDGFFMKTLPNPQIGSEIVQSGTGGFGPNTTHDTRVILTSETVAGEVITPRHGSYFMRSVLYKTKNYINLNGGSLDKPRSFFQPSNSVHNFDFDVEVWLGFSIRLPLNYEHEATANGDSGFLMFLSVNPNDTNKSLFTLRHITYAGAVTGSWDMRSHTDATSITESIGARVDYGLGAVAPDIGKWTDFVIRYRANPFAVQTNANTVAGGKNQVYQGNKGIFQLWKGEGAVDGSGNRQMVLKINKVNTPVGLVPNATDPILISTRVYKGGWKSNPSSVVGPIWFGMDDIRYGQVIRDSTGYADVSPSGLGQP